MGAINNAFTQAAGAVATAAYGIGKIKESQLEEGAKALERLPEAEAEVKDLESQKTDAEMAEINANAVLKGVRAEEVPTDPVKKLDWIAREKQAMDDVEAAKTAQATLEGKITARKAMIQRFEKQIIRANR